MSSIKYLNAVLTILAVLLTLNLYTGWMGSEAGDTLSAAAPAQAVGLPNSAAQRQKVIDQLKLLNTKVDALAQTLSDGSMRVRVEASASGPASDANSNTPKAK